MFLIFFTYNFFSSTFSSKSSNTFKKKKKKVIILRFLWVIAPQALTTNAQKKRKARNQEISEILHQIIWLTGICIKQLYLDVCASTFWMEADDAAVQGPLYERTKKDWMNSVQSSHSLCLILFDLPDRSKIDLC